MSPKLSLLFRTAFFSPSYATMKVTKLDTLAVRSSLCRLLIRFTCELQARIGNLINEANVWQCSDELVCFSRSMKKRRLCKVVCATYLKNRRRRRITLRKFPKSLELIEYEKADLYGRRKA